MIFKLVVLLLVFTSTARCSKVLDSVTQKGIFLGDYCPSMEYCREGSHVMCMYYDPQRVMGPHCSNAQNITITAELANQLLDVTNAIRSKVAKGKETGKDGEYLPRGYGIFRVKWDNELATFAQVLANQCVLRHDLCRATKRFPDPGQTVGLVRFTFPDWYPLSQSLSTSTPGLSEVKLAYAVTQSLKSWYAQKSSVTEDMVKKYPDWSLMPTDHRCRLYLDMIFGSTTHMGCGISAYGEYTYYENQRQMAYNSIQVICNYSGRPRKGEQSYTTEAPMPGRGFSPRCGCPEGSQEDNDCLCSHITKVTTPRPMPTSRPCSSPNENCEPTLVLLPIFTVEDAPPNKLMMRTNDIREPLENYIRQRYDNISISPRSGPAMEVFDIFDEAGKELHHAQVNVPQLPVAPHPRAPPPPVAVPHPLKSVLMPSYPTNEVIYRTPVAVPPEMPTFPPPPLQTHRPATPPPRPRAPPPRPPPPPPPPRQHQNHYQSAATKPEYYEEYDPEEQTNALQTPRKGTNNVPNSKKSSIFTRVAQFKLPGRKSLNSPNKVIKKDVTPRKDFSNLNKVVNEYLKHRTEFRRNEFEPFKGEEVVNILHNEENTDNVEKMKNEEKTKQEENLHREGTTTEAGLNKAEEKIINFNQYLKRNISRDDKIVDVKDDNDNKLMSLLDNLEQEVKHIGELEGDKKEIFDAKIRKIYDTAVGKQVDLFSLKQTNDNEIDVPEIDIGESKNDVKHEDEHNHEDKKAIKDDRKFNKHADIERSAYQFKKYDYSDRKRKDKTNDSSDLKKYNDNIDQNIFSDLDRKYSEHFDFKFNDNLDHKYNEIDHNKYSEVNKYIDNLDSKYNENSEHKHGDVQHKLIDNLDRIYNDNLDHNDNEDRKYPIKLASRNQVKYDGKRDLTEFKEFNHNTINSAEDIKYRNFNRYSDRDLKVGHGTPDRNMHRIKNSERKHRKRADGKKSKIIHYHIDPNDPLSIERRKYYQEKIENLERKLHNSRSFRRRNDHGNERLMRRMRPNRDNVQTRTRSKAQANSFYMPDRARFLHGF